MATPTPSPATTSTFTPTQWQALHNLRARYQQDRDLLSERERAHLRWLYHTGRLVP